MSSECMLRLGARRGWASQRQTVSVDEMLKPSPAEKTAGSFVGIHVDFVYSRAVR